MLAVYAAFIVSASAHQGVDHAWPLHAQCPHSLEDVHHTLCLQPVQQVGNGNIGASSTTPAAAQRGPVLKITLYHVMSVMDAPKGVLMLPQNTQVS